jgi:hypothetical protein
MTASERCSSSLCASSMTVTSRMPERIATISLQACSSQPPDPAGPRPWTASRSARSAEARIRRSSVDGSAPWAEPESIDRGSSWWAHLDRGQSALANGHGGETPRGSVDAV